MGLAYVHLSFQIFLGCFNYFISTLFSFTMWMKKLTGEASLHTFFLFGPHLKAAHGEYLHYTIRTWKQQSRHALRLLCLVQVTCMPCKIVKQSWSTGRGSKGSSCGPEMGQQVLLFYGIYWLGFVSQVSALFGSLQAQLSSTLLIQKKRFSRTLLFLIITLMRLVSD